MVRGRWSAGSALTAGWLGSMLFVGASFVGVACSDCAREGCEALSAPAPSKVRTGIAGSVASSSDVVANGCQECPFAATTLELWRTDALVTTPEARDTTVQSTAPQALQVDGTYSFPFDPGNYLVCATAPAREPCVAFVLGDGDMVTINVKLRFGPTSFFVFDAQGKGQEEIFEFAALAAPE